MHAYPLLGGGGNNNNLKFFIFAWQNLKIRFRELISPTFSEMLQFTWLNIYNLWFSPHHYHKIHNKFLKIDAAMGVNCIVCANWHLAHKLTCWYWSSTSRTFRYDTIFEAIVLISYNTQLKQVLTSDKKRAIYF